MRKLPHINMHLNCYSVEVWDNVYKSNLNPLHIKQNHLIRLITKSGYLDHTVNQFQSLNLLLFFHLIKYKIASVIYRHKTRSKHVG